MMCNSFTCLQGPRLRALAAVCIMVLGSACAGGSDNVGPTAQNPLPIDSTATIDTTSQAGSPVDSTTTPPDSNATLPTDSTGQSSSVTAIDGRSQLPGIVFASDNIPTNLLNNVNNGSKRGGGIDQSNVLSLLSDARAHGARIILKMSKGADDYIQNSDGTFSFTKWKALVDRFKSVNLGPYISDGTLMGHFLIDEPHRASKWGGKVIPQATVEAMAKYSKDIWPSLNTFVHTQMSWLANTSVSYVNLDAGWTQYAANKGAVNSWITGEISNARSKGLGLFVGMNALNGGNGSSGIRGTSSGNYSMSATELKNYGTVILNQSYACGFIVWAYNSTYYGRSDIKSALSNLSSMARSHVKTACRQ
jgi:hypothetical protein